MFKQSSADLTRYAEILEKSAEYIEFLESEKEDFQKQASLASKEPILDNLRKAGYSDEDLEKLAGLDPDVLGTIEKRASHGDSAWGMGSGGRPSKSDMDAFTSFLVS